MRGIVIAFLLLFSLSAQGQMVIDSYRFGAPFVPINEPLLDSFPTAAAAYSLRLLRTAYTGDAIVVRRSSNNDTLAIGFSGGVLDTAAMKTFCGANNCFVRRLYDQSGNGRDFVQTTAGNQPAIITSGTVLRDNGDVSLHFDGTNDWMEIPSSTAMFNFAHNGDDATIFSVQRFGSTSDPNAGYVLLDNCNTGTANVGFSFLYDDRFLLARSNRHSIFIMREVSGTVAAGFNVDDVITPNAIGLSYSKLDANNATAANRARGGFNGSADYGNNHSTNAPVASNATFNLTLGATGGTKLLFLVGAVQELIIYNSDQSSNRAAIETNINNFYLIY
jgi:hypothetical protein